MDSEDNMTTSIADLRNNHHSNTQQMQYDLYDNNLGKKMEYQLDNLDYNPDIIPQATLQKAPPMRQGQIDNFPTHQTIKQHNFYPPSNSNYYSQNKLPNKNVVIKEPEFIEGVMNGLYERILDPLILTLLFIILSHRIIAKGINAYLPFVGMSPSTDFVSLGLRGFILSIFYLIIKNNLQ